MVHRPAVNEELGANAVQGSQLASASAGQDLRRGHRDLVRQGPRPGPGHRRAAARQPGRRATARGGVLVLVGDDSIAKSSTVPSSSEMAMAEIGMPVLAPADPQDVLDLGLHGIALSRFCGLWTGFKLATNVVDGAASVQVGLDRLDLAEPDRSIGGTDYVHEVSAQFLQPNLGRLEASLMGERLELARRYARANHLNRIEGDARARVGIVAAGSSYLDVRQALRMIGIGPGELASSGVRILKLGMVSPLEPRIVEEFARGLDEIVVVEEKRAFIELALKDQLYGQPDAPLISGRRTPGGTPMFRPTADLPPDVMRGRWPRASSPTSTSPPSRRGWPPSRTRRGGRNCCRSPPGPPTSAPGARTTGGPRCRRARWSGRGSAARRWPCSCPRNGSGTSSASPRWAARATVGGHGAVRHASRTCSRTSGTGRSTTPAAWPSGRPSGPGPGSRSSCSTTARWP